MSSNLPSCGQPVQASPLAVDAVGVADLLNVSPRHVRAMHAAGKLPRPIRLGRAVRWSVPELTAWLSAGAPARDVWERECGTRPAPARS